MTGLSRARLPRLERGDLRRDGRGGAAAAPRRRADDAGDRADRDLDGGLAKAADTSVAREYHAGMATMSGIQAVRAAQRGYKAEERILEMKLGFFEALRRRRRHCRRRLPRDTRSRRLLGHRHRHGGEAGARRPPLSRARRGRRQCRARRQDRRGGRRKHHRVAPRHDRADRPAASEGPDRHGAQPGLFPRRRRRRPRIFLGACDAGENRRPGHPRADRQGPRRPAAGARMPRATARARP